ncbi:hypothetical protein [Flavobacterium sp.]|uniref:hypothetical protein n=1 Tax=Flavobacterium sp. TaxID=239 RepID=UPI0011FE4337|nr:hypothetical protein [Flavobacterium sp.]RZJ73072.1 MAG: hypothetical protein EOO49_05425 [Flavobacterium sp.]
MKFFPSTDYEFKLSGNQVEAMERLERRTGKSRVAAANRPEKSFLGSVDQNRFTLTSSQIGAGALCKLSGKIDNGVGRVKVELKMAFKIVFSAVFILPIGGTISEISKTPDKALLFVIVGILQFLMIRFFFIEYFFFRRSARKSLDRLSDVLDIESIKKV